MLHPSRWMERVLQRTPYILLGITLYRFLGLDFGDVQPTEALYALRTLAVWKFGALADQSSFLPGGMNDGLQPPLYLWVNVIANTLLGFDTWVFRIGAALAGGGMVLLTYRLARLMLPKEDSLIAGVFVGFAPLLTFFSRQGEPETLLGLLLLSGLHHSCRVLTRIEWSRIVALGLLVSLALMTKLFVAFILPVALIITALSLKAPFRSRVVFAALVALTFSVLAIPWIVHVVSFYTGQGYGAIQALGVIARQSVACGYQDSIPVPALTHLSTLVVTLSFFFPPFVVGLWRAMRPYGTHAAKLLAVFSLVSVAWVWYGNSPSESVLIVVLPGAVILAVKTIHEARNWHSAEQAWLASLMSLCTVWSLAPWFRSGVKQVLQSVVRFTAPDFGAVLIVMPFVLLFLAALGMIRRAYRRYALEILFEPVVPAVLVLALGVGTLVRTWVMEPLRFENGAEATVERLNELDVRLVAIIGHAVDHQLSFYLDGEDLGWKGDSGRIFRRFEPIAMGARAVRHKLVELAGTHPVALILRREEISAGSYRTPREILPAGSELLMEGKRYALAVLRTSE